MNGSNREDARWVRDRVNFSEMARPFCASTLLHILMVAVLASSSPFCLVAGPQTRIDIVWATAASLPAEARAPGREADRRDASRAEKTALVEVSPLPAVDSQVTERVTHREMDLLLAPTVAGLAGEPGPGGIMPGAKPSRSVPKPRRTFPLQRKPVHSAEHVGQPTAVKGIEPLVSLVEVEVPEGDRSGTVPAESQTLPVAEKALTPAPLPEGEGKRIERPEVRAALELKRPAALAKAERADARLQPVTPHPAPDSASAAVLNREHGVMPVSEPRRQEKELHEKGSPQRGVVVGPSLRGDLKLIVKGDTGIKVSVKFREYAVARRKKALSRTESRREQTVLPVVGMPQEGTREAAVQTAREGVYLFSVEPEEATRAKASFTLRIHEGGPRDRSAALGTRTITGKITLFKVLMPEGILWDDDSAFTGSMEDSDSETKYNATTGLYWKEYKE